jgi:hypothetical protein
LLILRRFRLGLTGQFEALGRRLGLGFLHWGEFFKRPKVPEPVETPLDQLLRRSTSPTDRRRPR